MKKILAIFTMTFISFQSWAAPFQCFEFKWTKINIRSGIEKRPGIISKRVRVNEEIVVITQDIVPLNEKVYDLLYSLKDGDKVCLKGTLGIHIAAPVQFHAFDASLQEN